MTDPALSFQMKTEPWTTRPISPTCEVLRAGTGVSLSKDEHKGAMCDAPTAICYPAHGGGWMALCEAHGQKHLPHASRIADLIKAGETFEGMEVAG